MVNEKEAGRQGIVVGVDGSEASINALRWAYRQAMLTDSPLDVVMAWHIPVSYGLDTMYPQGFDPQEENLSALRTIADGVAGKDPQVPVRLIVVECNPAPELKKRSEDASLLVIGSRGHGGFAGLLLGSVSEYLIAHAACPVVVVRNFSSDS